MADEQPDQDAPQPAQRLSRRAAGVGRRASTLLGTLSPYQRLDYPHDTHPALVPGIGIDEQRREYHLNWFVFSIAGSLTVAFVIWGVVNPDSVQAVATAAFDWTIAHAGWLFNAVALAVLVFLIVLACSPYGRIPLGRDDEEPEYSTFAWVAMLFAAGIGIGLFFFGPAEPLSHFHSPPPRTHPAESVEAIHTSLAQTYYHWGFHAWALYALVGGAVAYAAYRRGRVPLMSSIFRALFGKRHSEGLAGQLVDIFAIIATLFGTAAALGLAAMQIGEGVSIVTGWTDMGNTAVVLIVAILGVGFVVSAVSGVSRGIRYLSSTNIVITMGVIFLVFLAGPTLHLLHLLPSGLMEYFSSFFEMMGRSASWGEETLDFQATWTIYYWAWWISWSPFVGIFIARVSRGRSIRQFLLGTIIIPSSLLFIAYGILGGAAMWMSRHGVGGVEADMDPPQVLFSVVGGLPFVEWLPVVVIIALAIFFITSADSASVVMGILSTGGDLNPNRLVVVFWGVVMGGIAIVMLSIGGDSALEGLQSLVIVTALPFAAVMILIAVAWVRDLRTDPGSLRKKYADKALSDAVIEGVERYGDDFALQVAPTKPDEGAGREVDSEEEEYTEWYQRTDEEGDPVEYDFETGEWGEDDSQATEQGDNRA